MHYAFGMIDEVPTAIKKDLLYPPLNAYNPTNNDETVALLSKLNTENHLDIEIGEYELSEIDFSKEATYGEIKKYVLDKYGLKVSSLYYCTSKKETWSNRKRKL